MALGFVVSGALLTEIVFSYPGQGYLLVRAVASLDYPLIQGLYLTITLAVLGANLLLDLVSAWVDPRLRRAHMTSVAAVRCSPTARPSWARLCSPCSC